LSALVTDQRRDAALAKALAPRIAG
jgi:hypothetical protein